MIRFLISGSISSLVEYSTFVIVSVFLTVPLLVAQPMSFLSGVASSYSLNKFWVFKAAGEHRRSMTMFGLLALFNAIASTLLIHILVNSFEVYDLLAKLIVMGAVAVWNYLVFSKVIFTEGKP